MCIIHRKDSVIFCCRNLQSVGESRDREGMVEKEDFPPFYQKLFIDTQGILLPSDEIALYCGSSLRTWPNAHTVSS